MKTKVLLLLLVGLLATTGSTCINDGFLVAVNLPMKATFAINAGPNLVFSGTQTVKLADLIDETYLDNIKSARYYDIRISTAGTYNGKLYFTAKIDGTELLRTKTQPWPWSDFATPQSLLGTSTKIEPVSAGLARLVSRLIAFKTDPTVSIVLSADGTLSEQTPVPAGLSVTLEILAQVDAEVK